ncbi:uncharacterized protein LOC123978352 [Micropterus dolomieu]|uniref:uncharacterized protein LOC123978352 n=1 Tax=Micropterus dolomieu TaxID=147949 RepID=UPI001E8E284F|nr:uncharacterized protein LOC123978352 [Micropterus dolomieu]
MVEFKWIKTSLSLMLVLPFTTVASRQLFLSLTVRVGDEVTLSCENVIDDQDNCDSTKWLFRDSRNTAAEALVELGKNGVKAKAQSDRLSATENCSLVIKTVTVEDVGRYDCRQFNNSGGKRNQDAVVHLSVINMTEHKEDDKVTLTCSVSTYERCTTTVKWLFKGKEVDKDNQDLKTSQSPCSVSVSFLTSHFIHTLKHNVLKCEVTNGNKVQEFPFRRQPTGEDKKTGTTESTTTENSIKAGITMTASAINDDSTGRQSNWWWLYILVSVVLAALLIIVVKSIRWKRAKETKTGMNENVGLTSDPAVTPERTQTQTLTGGGERDTADPEDGVSYAAVSFTIKTNNKGRVQSKNDADEGDAVTYTTVKASSADPSNLYATIS